MTPWAKAASKAFYATLAESGRGVDAKALELAWERAAIAAAEYHEEIELQSGDLDKLGRKL